MQAVLDGLSERVRTAAAAGRRLSPRGGGTWWPELLESAEALDLSGLTEVTRLDATDLVASAGAGCPLNRLGATLAAQGVWLALDPPGTPQRTLGGVLASGGGGPLASLFGSPRDQVLGMTMLAGNGTIVRTGGRVVKNVAGFDLSKAIVGSHGAFGAIVEANLRLRALPAADRTAAFSGSLPNVAALCGAMLAAGASPGACEVMSPALAADLGLGTEWVAAVRALGTQGGVEEDLELAADCAAASGCVALDPAPDLWARWQASVGAWPVVLRFGADPSSWQDALALAGRPAGVHRGASVTAMRGTVRLGASGMNAGDVRMLRADAARRGWPLTLERGAPALLAEAGVWGELSQGVERLTRSLRRVFDPDGVFNVPLLA